MEKTVILKFTKDTWNQPVIHGLSRNCDLVFSILEAKVLPRQEAYAIMSLEGAEEEFKKGLEYLKKSKVVIEDVPDHIKRDDDSCVSCGTCTAVCPTDALFTDGPELYVTLDPDKCVACGNCVNVCPVRCIDLFVI
jgi:ferredoxin